MSRRQLGKTVQESWSHPPLNQSRFSAKIRVVCSVAILAQAILAQVLFVCVVFCVLSKTNCYGSQRMECRPHSKWMVRSDSWSQASVRTVDFPTSTRIRQGQSPRQTSRTLAQSFTSPSRCFPQSSCQSRRGSRDRLCQGEAVAECHQRARRGGPVRCMFARGIAEGPFQGASHPRRRPHQVHRSIPRKGSKAGIGCQEGVGG